MIIFGRELNFGKALKVTFIFLGIVAMAQGSKLNSLFSPEEMLGTRHRDTVSSGTLAKYVSFKKIFFNLLS